MSYLIRDTGDGRSQVLLGRKKKGLGEGNFVGLGGKLEPGESALAAAVRETAEESGLVVAESDLQPRGLLTYLFPHREAWSQESSVFVCTAWSGTPRESDELNPEWFDLEALPLDEMWDDARYWLPGVLAGKAIVATFTFGADLATVRRHTVQVDQLARECQDRTGPISGSRSTSESAAISADSSGS
ncbi:NUDIX domain-containing protein [Glaciibacter psychrotolerans]|uniref:Oxidized purine nucleoside triphosphate hydrolase n=1 Tax=Glaciibacter psychrotolerans TaxID=670054 RepID=A0A7Z0EE48_9MICO|nr:8-oxo-dGTP diphosphatase [Leifsonia psychrotolerans]